MNRRITQDFCHQTPIFVADDVKNDVESRTVAKSRIKTKRGQKTIWKPPPQEAASSTGNEDGDAERQQRRQQSENRHRKQPDRKATQSQSGVKADAQPKPEANTPTREAASASAFL